MTRDGEIPAIFNPKRVRAPSVVVTEDSPNGPFGGFTNIISGSNPQITHSDSISSSHHDGGESGGIFNQINNNVIERGGVATPATTITPGSGQTASDLRSPTPQANSRLFHSRRLRACKDSCCSELAQKMYFGVCVTILVTASWVGATHCIKFLYLKRSTYTVPQAIDFEDAVSLLDSITGSASEQAADTTAVGINTLRGIETIPNQIRNLPTHILEENDSSISDDGNSSELATTTIFNQIPKSQTTTIVFNAPFFASWFCTNFAFLFFPIYMIGRISLSKCDKPGEILGDVLRGFRDRGFTIGRFFNRCLTFCVLWVVTTYLYALSLRYLLATDVLALFATNVACVYLLSWVILHEQFVGVRIVAVILCDTGIALLAYMDGITGSPTLGGVVLAVLAAAGYAVFKVMFRKVMGDPPIGQIAFTFTTLGFLNAALLWPVCLALYFTGIEVMPSERLPWIMLLIASILLLVFHILTQFSAAVTYNLFVTLGLITAVPVSGALDVLLYGAQFAGMKLAGVILIAVGFFLVMFPENWPDYITRLLRKFGRAILRYQCCCEFAEIDNENSKYHLVGSQREMGSRSPQRFFTGSASNRHRLSDGLHPFTSSFAFRQSEMTDLSPSAFFNFATRTIIPSGPIVHATGTGASDGGGDSAAIPFISPSTGLFGRRRADSHGSCFLPSSSAGNEFFAGGTTAFPFGVGRRSFRGGSVSGGSGTSEGIITDDLQIRPQQRKIFAETNFLGLAFRRKSSAASTTD